ncbi:MAG: flagellar hook-associated protein FlgK [Firmicutes bacterium]|nr:flagellar hook-associated protein FlgK [Bacillota bacterium]
MRSTFMGLETARRALMAQQIGLETTAHNIANANTPGYSRQVVQIQAATPFSPPSWISPAIPGQIGTGVEVAAIQRMRDAFLDGQIRQETSSLGRWETESGLLNQIELIYNEPSDSGIRNAIDGFWQALQDLSINPESGSARTVVLRRGEALADILNHTYTQLEELRDSINEDIAVRVTEINTYAHKIAALNKQIVDATSVGDHPNDLMDQRDKLISELSKLVDVNVITDKYNATTVTVGGVPIVQWDSAREIETRDDDNNGLYEIYWKGSPNQVQFRDGVLKGLVEMRDVQLSKHLDAVENIIGTLMTQFNAVHQNGYGLNGQTGLNFFEYTDEPLMRVAVTEDQIAASSLGTDADGDGVIDSIDGENARSLADILTGKIDIYDKDDPSVIVASGTTLRDYFSSTISQLGVDAQHAMRMTENQDVLVNNLESRQEAVAGVSIDEEMVNMMKFQHAYNAAARVMTGLDEMYDVIINRMGLVGR